MRYTIQILLLGIASVAFAQGTQKLEKDSSLVRDIIVEKEFQPIINDASKLQKLPAITPPPVVKLPVQYTASGFGANLIPQSSLLKTESVRVDLPENSPLGYASLRLGNYWNIQGDARFNLLKDGTNDLSVRYSLLSTEAHRKLNQQPWSPKVSDWNHRLGIDYSTRFSSLFFAAGARMMHHSFNYWAVDSIAGAWQRESSVAESRQRATQLELFAQLRSEEESLIRWDAGISHSLFNRQRSMIPDVSALMENRLKLFGDIHTLLTERWSLKVHTNVTSYWYNAPSVMKDYGRENAFYNRVYWTLNPTVGYTMDQFTFKAGLRMESLFLEETAFFVAPDLGVRWTLSPSFELYTTMTGQVNQNGFEQTHAQTPYMAPFLRKTDTKTPYDWVVGVQANHRKELSGRISFGVERRLNEQFLVNLSDYYQDVVDGSGTVVRPSAPQGYVLNLFGLTEKKNITFSKLALDGAWQPMESLRVSLAIEQRFWNNSDHVLQLPSTLVDWAVRYTPIEPLYLSLTYQYQGGRKALNPVSNEIESMKAVNNMQLAAQYKLNKKVTFNVTLNNILNQKYDWWYGVPAQRFGVMGGVVYTF